MTMIAAFRSIGMPALIGDLLVTRRGVDDGTIKKIAILHERLALGHAGQLISIKPVMSAISEWVKTATVSKASLDEFLTSEAMANQGDGHPFVCILVGWVVDPDGTQHCFRWRSDYPSAVFDGDPMYEGTGGADAEALLRNGPTVPPDEAAEVDEHLMRVCVCNAAMALMSEELRPSGKCRDAYGFAFEAIIFQGGEFRYLSNNSLHYLVEIEYGGDGELKYMGVNLSVVFVRSGKKFTEVIKAQLNPARQKIHLICPVIFSEEELKNQTALMGCRHLDSVDWSYTLGLEWTNIVIAGHALPPLYTSRDPAQHNFSFNGSKIEWTPDFRQIEMIVPVMLKDMTAGATGNLPKE